jgi:hypothetical protein
MGDPQPQQLFACVGVAMTEFESLQHRVGWLFETLLGVQSQALKRAFGTLENVPQRSKMIREVAKLRFLNDKPRRVLIKAMMNQYEELSHRRNEIAHGSVVKFTHNNSPRGHYLAPGSHISSRNAGGAIGLGEGLGDYAYTSAQLQHYIAEFVRLRGEIWDLIDELQKERPPHALP